jgi:hypothetical protein
MSRHTDTFARSQASRAALPPGAYAFTRWATSVAPRLIVRSRVCIPSPLDLFGSAAHSPRAK